MQQGNREPTRQGRVQGEGDYESARRFNEDQREFVDAHGTPRPPKVDPDQERELRRAEEIGKSRSKGSGHDATDEAIMRDEMDHDARRGEE